MSTKQNIIFHMDGIKACGSKDYEHALKLFMRITEPSAPICFNIGCCYLRLHNNKEALKMFEETVSRDRYLAIGHFQLGVAQALCGDLRSAADSFQAAYDALRGNPFIDYKQLNMPCKLYASEVNFNLGLVYLFRRQYDVAKDYIQVSAGLPLDSHRHSTIPAAVDAAERDDWSFFGNKADNALIMLPDHSFFHVSKAKTVGLQTSTKFMDEAKVVAAVNDDYSFVGFVGAKKLQQQQASNNQGGGSPSPKRSNPPVGPPPSVPPPRLPPNLSQSKQPTETVKPLVSRPGGRQSSPSRPPPPVLAPPKSVPPSKPPPKVEKSAIKSMQSTGNAITELRSKLEPATFKMEDKPTKSPYTKVVKNYDRSGENSQQTVKVNFEFAVDITKHTSYEDLVESVVEKLKRASSKLSSDVQRRSMIFQLDDPKKTRVTSDNSNWRSALTSVMRNRQSIPLLTLQDNSDGILSEKQSTPTLSPGYKPSRPAPAISTSVEDDIYHTAY